MLHLLQTRVDIIGLEAPVRIEGRVAAACAAAALARLVARLRLSVDGTPAGLSLDPHEVLTKTAVEGLARRETLSLGVGFTLILADLGALEPVGLQRVVAGPQLGPLERLAAPPIQVDLTRREALLEGIGRLALGPTLAVTGVLGLLETLTPAHAAVEAFDTRRLSRAGLMAATPVDTALETTLAALEAGVGGVDLLAVEPARVAFADLFAPLVLIGPALLTVDPAAVVLAHLHATTLGLAFAIADRGAPLIAPLAFGILTRVGARLPAALAGDGARLRRPGIFGFMGLTTASRGVEANLEARPKAPLTRVGFVTAVVAEARLFARFGAGPFSLGCGPVAPLGAVHRGGLEVLQASVGHVRLRQLKADVGVGQLGAQIAPVSGFVGVVWPPGIGIIGVPGLTGFIRLAFTFRLSRANPSPTVP